MQHDGAKDRGSVGQPGHRDLQRPKISAWLTGAYPELQEEKRAIVEAGLNSSAWQHMDDTGTRVNGVNQHCQIICNPL